MDGLGGVADNGEVNIEWNSGLAARKKFEVYVKKKDPNVEKLSDGSTTFDLVYRAEGSNKR